MLLIYYRDAAGKICDYMRPPADWTLGQVKREIENFNTLHDGRVRAYMEFVREYGLNQLAISLEQSDE